MMINCIENPEDIVRGKKVFSLCFLWEGEVALVVKNNYEGTYQDVADAHSFFIMALMIQLWFAVLFLGTCAPLKQAHISSNNFTLIYYIKVK